MSVLLKALIDYFQICKTSLCLSKISLHFRPTGSSLNFWPLFKQEWIDSLRGPKALHQCLCFSLYEKTFRGIPYQKLGVYIQENQPWEMALIYFWKASGHGKLIGVPHATVRYWDMRYFYDSLSYRRTGKNDLPIPDLVAVNGPVAKKLYLEGGYPEQQLTEVEALRFSHLLNGRAVKAPNKSKTKSINVLVCGDFLSSTNHKLLSWLAIAAQSLPKDISYVIKPHPAYPIDPNDLKLLPLEVTEAPFEELFANCDVVYTSNMTSAAVDAYCSGTPVIQMLDGQTFNVSPLRNIRGVVYVKNPIELAEALQNNNEGGHFKVEPYFYLDEDLPRWRGLLGLGLSSEKPPVSG